MFADEAKIYLKAGDGGNGCIAFRREKFVPRGGPSGADGGHGGSIYLEANPHDNTLLRYRYNREFKADRGRHGEGSNCSGHAGGDMTLLVPVGTVVTDQDTGEQIADLTKPGQRVLVARGGRGGRGNQHFAKPWHQAPREWEDGQPGEDRHLRLELKLLADVGLVGFPNAGKSTLISRISAAHPKIADYPFTTLEPNLGVVSVDDRTFVAADIPGLIEGAHLGHRLWARFLRRIERPRLLVQLVDVSESSGRDPVEDFGVVMEELASFREDMIRKPMLVVASKIDVAQDPGRIARLKALAGEKGLPFYEISSVTGQGIEALKYEMAQILFKPVEEDIKQEIKQAD